MASPLYSGTMYQNLKDHNGNLISKQDFISVKRLLINAFKSKYNTKDMIDNNDTLYVIRDESNKMIVGVCSLTVLKRRAIAHWMAIRSEYRGKGVGRFLISCINEINRDRIIELAFEPHLTRFYEELGYTTTKGHNSDLMIGIRKRIRHD